MKQDNSQIAVAVFNKLAQLYQEKFMNVSVYHKSFDLFCNAVQKKNPEILELACGPGNITKYLLQKRIDFNILATDLAPNMIALAKNNNPSASFQILDSRKINSLNKKFDAVMSGFVLPYLNKEEVKQLIADISFSLNSKGVVYLSTMEANYSTSGLTKGGTGDEIFMHYYLEEDLVPLLKENHFEILKIDRVPTSEPTINDIIIIAKLHD